MCNSYFLHNPCLTGGNSLLASSDPGILHTTRNQINDTFLFQNRVKVKVVGEVSEK